MAEGRRCVEAARRYERIVQHGTQQRSSVGRAAEIAGARDALRAQTGVLLPPVHPAAYEPMLEVVRDTLGEVGFSAAHARLADRPPPELIAAVTREEQS